LSPDKASVVDKDENQSNCWMRNKVHKMDECVPMVNDVVSENNGYRHSNFKWTKCFLLGSDNNSERSQRVCATCKTKRGEEGVNLSFRVGATFL
jgi:hypothetical protein